MKDIQARVNQFMLRQARLFSIRLSGRGTALETVTGWNHAVTETPEQIMAMDAMVYELYPAMMVNADGTIGRIK